MLLGIEERLNFRLFNLPTITRSVVSQDESMD